VSEACRDLHTSRMPTGDLSIGQPEYKGEDDVNWRQSASDMMVFDQSNPPSKKALAAQTFTASDADIKPHSVNAFAIKHKPVSIHHHHMGKQEEAKPPPLSRILDGFHVLEASSSHLPTDVRQAVFVDRGLVGVVEEDLIHFDRLQLLDVSENNLQLSMFAILPRLKALNLACNAISTIERSYGFDSLQLLDLSYNKLSQRSVQMLDFLPNLKELDLCGNNLGGIPMEMFRFMSLEKLLLDNNKMDDNQVFNILSTIPNLRMVTLAYNFLHSIPPQCCAEGYFPLLGSIDVSFNYFGTEEDVQALVDLPRLEAIVLYGNPMLGATGEDPLYNYIEELQIAATDGRIERRLPRIEVTTEIPRKRNFKKLKGRSAGRHASYRDFGIIAVAGDFEGGESTGVKTNNEWREEGNKTLFAEAIAQAQKEKTLASIPDMTFITAGEEGTDEKILRMADNVMDKVAADLDLATSAEILYFQDRTKLRTNESHLEQPDDSGRGWEQDPDEELDEDTTWLNAEEPDSSMPPSRQPSARPQDKVPPAMFARTMADPSTLQTHPVAVKTAMRALQFAIQHPLTNYDEVPAKGGLPPKDYVRETAASVNRKMPKQVASMKPLSDIAAIKNKSKRGLGEPSVVAATRKKAQAQTMIQIEDVLDKLNANADEIALKGSGNVNTKDGINTMKNFARPQTGLRGLVRMVDEVVDDLGK
jgi:hypothetical protein